MSSNNNNNSDNNNIQFCQICKEEAAKKRLSILVCDQHFEEGYDGLVQLGRRLRDEYQQQQVEQEQEQELEQEQQPTTALPPPATEQEPKPELITYETELHKLVNEARKKAGLGELQYDDKLAEISEKHSIDMSPVGRNYYREGYSYPNPHINPDGLDHADRANKAGYTNWRYIGENIARFNRRDLERWTKQQVAQQLFNQWWNSPGHKRNMMSPNYNREGIGVYKYQNGIWATQMLSRLKNR